jgi:hypothetical protein
MRYQTSESYREMPHIIDAVQLRLKVVNWKRRYIARWLQPFATMKTHSYSDHQRVLVRRNTQRKFSTIFRFRLSKRGMIRLLPWQVCGYTVVMTASYLYTVCRTAVGHMTFFKRHWSWFLASDNRLHL